MTGKDVTDKNSPNRDRDCTKDAVCGSLKTAIDSTDLNNKVPTSSPMDPKKRAYRKIAFFRCLTYRSNETINAVNPTAQAIEWNKKNQNLIRFIFYFLVIKYSEGKKSELTFCASEYASPILVCQTLCQYSMLRRVNLTKWHCKLVVACPWKLTAQPCHVPKMANVGWAHPYCVASS